MISISFFVAGFWKFRGLVYSNFKTLAYLQTHLSNRQHRITLPRLPPRRKPPKTSHTLNVTSLPPLHLQLHQLSRLRLSPQALSFFPRVNLPHQLLLTFIQPIRCMFAYTPAPDAADVCVFDDRGKGDVCYEADYAADPGGEGEGDGDDDYAY